MDIEKQVDQIVQQVIADITGKIQQQVLSEISQQIANITSKMDYNSLFRAAITASIKNNEFIFPERSIPSSALDTSLTITGDQITGGIIKQFGSTGIDDQATECQVTIMDSVTVVENNLLTKDLTVKGTATIEGDLNVTGTVPESSGLFQNIVKTVTDNVRTSLDSVVFQHYAALVVDTINRDGLDLNKITLNGEDIIDRGSLGSNITYSNLQRVGTLQELQVQGETLLSQTLYTSSKRVGINTFEPAQALSIWDQEIEIGFGKHGTNTAIIGTPRNHTLIVGTNARNNITLTPDGGVTIQELTLGEMKITNSDSPPSKNQPKGTLVFNNNPTLGGPLGWISLGDAKWANFGYID
jgi:hypothetical protein